MALIGIPLSAALSPLVVAVAVVVDDIANRVVSTPDLLGPFRDLMASNHVADVPRLVVSLGIVLVLPGAVALVACWVAVRRLFGPRRHGGRAVGHGSPGAALC